MLFNSVTAKEEQTPHLVDHIIQFDKPSLTFLAAVVFKLTHTMQHHFETFACVVIVISKTYVTVISMVSSAIVAFIFTINVMNSISTTPSVMVFIPGTRLSAEARLVVEYDVSRVVPWIRMVIKLTVRGQVWPVRVPVWKGIHMAEVVEIPVVQVPVVVEILRVNIVTSEFIKLRRIAER